MSLLHIIFLWETYNRQLLDLLKRMSEEYLQRECYTNAGMLSMEFLIRNYLENMELHLAVVVCYQTSAARINSLTPHSIIPIKVPTILPFPQ
jgi:hypothetical protein